MQYDVLFRLIYLKNFWSLYALIIIFYNCHQKIRQFPENLSRIVNCFDQKSLFFSLPDSCFKNPISIFLLGSLEDSHVHYYKNVNRSYKEKDENHRDKYLDNKELFLISNDTKMKGNVNVAILESFVNFYKNLSKIISLS